MTRSLPAFVFALALAAGCRETLRAPPKTNDTIGASGSSATGYAIAPVATGGGLGGGAGDAGAATDGGLGGGAGDAGAAGMGPWIFEGRGKYVELKNAPIAMNQKGDEVLDGTGMLWSDCCTMIPTVTPTIPAPVSLSSDGTMVEGNVGPSPCSMMMTWMQGGPLVWPAVVQVAPGDGIVATSCASPRRAMRFNFITFLMVGELGRLLDLVDGDDTSEALRVSRNGVIVGLSSKSAEGTGRLVAWINETLVTVQDAKIRRPAFGVFISDSGSMVAGTTIGADGTDSIFSWEISNLALGPATTALRALPEPAGRLESLAFGLSADGTTVLALGTNAPSGPPTATAQDGLPFTVGSDGTGLLVMPVPPPFIGFESVRMTPDASLIVGNPTPNPGMPAVVWDSQRTPSLLFEDAPMFLQRCRPIVTHVAADGKTFAGSCDATARKTGFVARF